MLYGFSFTSFIESICCAESDFCDIAGCTGKCADLPDGPLCYCDEGFTLLNDSKSCAGINMTTFICTKVVILIFFQH